MERPTESLPVPAKNSLRNFRDTAMRSARKQLAGFDGPLKPLPAILVLVAALAVALVPLARAADSPGETLKRQFEAAKAFLDAGDLLQAESHFRQTLALGLRQLGNLSISEGQYEQATRYLDDALKLKPDDVETQADAAIAWFRRGDLKKAKVLIKTALASQPNHARAHNILGRINLSQGDFEGAIKELKAAVALQDDFETAYFLGIAYLKAKKLAETSALFAKIQSSMGESAALHVLFGRAYTIAHFPEPAMAEFRRALKLDPKYPRAHGLLGYAYLEQFGEEAYPQAREEFEKELKRQPDQYYFLTLLGIATVALRDFPAAETALLHASRVRPEEASPYLYLGETYVETNRIKEAVEALEKYVSLVSHPEEMLREVSRGYYLLGQSLLRLGRGEEAKKALARSQQYREAKFKYDQEHIFEEKQSSEDDGESRASDRIAGLLEAGSPEEKQAAQAMIQRGLPAAPTVQQSAAETKETLQYRAFVADILASSYNDLGAMHAKDSKFADAAEFFKQAASWKSDLPGVDRNWGLASFRAKLYSDAIPPLERQLTAHPDDSFVRQLLGLCYFTADNYPRTAQVLRPFLENPPDDAGLLYAWGVALVRTRQSDLAARIFRRLLEQNANNPEIHLLLGQAYARQEDYPNALSELRTALHLDPQLLRAHYYAGLVLLHQSEFESAAQEFRAELELHPADPVTSYHLAFALLSQGRAEQAVTLLCEVVKARPDYEFAYFELGRALLQLGDVARAIENLETAKKLSPDHDATYYQLSQAYRRAGRVQEAEEALATYRKLIEGSRLKKRESLETEKP